MTATGISQASVAVILPAGHPLATRRALRLPDLADARWIEAEQVAPPLAEIRRQAGTDGFRPAFRYTESDVLSLMRLAAAGHGLTLLPDSPALPALRQRDIAAVHVTTPRVVHRVGTHPRHSAASLSPAAALAAILVPH